MISSYYRNRRSIMTYFEKCMSCNNILKLRANVITTNIRQWFEYIRISVFVYENELFYYIKRVEIIK